MARQFLSLHPATQASRLIKRLTSKLPLSTITTIRRYSKQGKDGSGDGIDQQRARSTAEEFKRVAEEKSRDELSSQTAEKARDGAEEATIGTSEPQHVEEAHKDSPQRDD